MNVSNMSEKQIEIFYKLKEVFEDSRLLESWLSLPNKMFKNKAPIDVLLSGNYDYFERFLQERK